MKRLYLLCVLSAVLLAGCVSQPTIERAGIPTVWRPSPNFGERRPEFVILHHTGDDTAEQALHTLTDSARQVSAHYLVGRDGTIYQLVDERARAWHAGRSAWGSDEDLNSSSLGIELDNNGHEPFPDIQINALLRLLDDIERRYHIPSENFIGHADIAPHRKVDPSGYFPWQQLAEHGYGRWCRRFPLPDLPPFFDTDLALRALGYDTANLGAAIYSFKLHYIPDDVNFTLTYEEQKVLYCLVDKDK